MDQRGQVLPLVALVAVAAGGLLLGVARFGADVSRAARAQAAADAAALAGAAVDREEAEALAEANGAVLATFEAAGREVEVRTRVGDLWAVAKARRVAGEPGVIGWVGAEGSWGAAARLSPALRARLAVAASELHQPVPLVAVSGRAVDVPTTFVARLDAVRARTGLCRTAPQTRPVRFELCAVPPT